MMKPESMKSISLIAFASMLALSNGCLRPQVAVYRFIDGQTGETVTVGFGLVPFSREISIVYPDDKSLKVYWRDPEPLELEVTAAGYERQVVLLTPGEHTVALKSKEKSRPETE